MCTGVLEDYFLAFMAGCEEKDFNYYPPGDWGWGERIQVVTVPQWKVSERQEGKRGSERNWFLASFGLVF